MGAGRGGGGGRAGLPEEVTSTVQQAVSFLTSNANKVIRLQVCLQLFCWFGFSLSLYYVIRDSQSECTISLAEESSENLVLAATLEQWAQFRMRKNMSDLMLYSEKVKYFR